MIFDIRTLAIVSAISAVVFAFAMVTVARLVVSERYLRHWAWGSSAGAIGTFLLGLRGVWPDLITIVLANTLLVMGVIWVYSGTCGLVGRAPPGRAWWLVAVLACAALAWFTFVYPHVPARVLVVSLALAPLMGLCARAYWQHDRVTGPSPLRIANYVTLAVMLLGLLLFVGRIAPAFTNQSVSQYTQSSSALYVAPHLWATLFNVWLAIFVTLTVSARLQKDLVVARDVAQAHSQAKSQFLANMSHEIRTPMNAILGMLQLLQTTELNPRQQDYTEKSQDAARSLLGVINDILDFSKVEAGKMALDPEPFALESMLRGLSVVLSANMGEKNIDVLFDIDPAVPPVLVGDAMRLHQVLLNLGGNAIKFTAQGQVVIAVQLQSQGNGVARVHFAVQDSGIGIAPENQAHIFTGFAQAEASTTRRFGGTGLGLSISLRLVALMGGHLQLTSTLGQGSTFFFALDFPLVPAAQVGDAGHLPVAPSTVPPRSVLLVAANPVAAELMAKSTRALAWPTTIVHSGEQAMALVQAHTTPQTFAYQVIYLAWQLPGQDGWETLRQLRALASTCAGQEPAIVMVCNHSRQALSHRTAQEQAMLTGYLVQPVTPAMLTEAVLAAPAVLSRVRQVARNIGSPRRLNGLRILVVEDNRINQQVAEELLVSEGAVVSLAANGQLGVEAVATADPPFDAVLMDVQMPVMDGYAATRLIRHQLGLADLPVIAMTANAMASDRDACLAAGMNDHIGKPFDLAELVVLLRRYARGVEDSPAASVAAAECAPATLPPLVVPAVPVDAIDVDAALVRMGGMQSLYLQAAQAFLKTLPGMVPEFLRLLPHDPAAAKRAMHTLKGNAGLLGATQLAQQVAQLESLCEQPRDTAHMAKLAQALSEAIARTEAALRMHVKRLQDAQPVQAASAEVRFKSQGVVSPAVVAALNRLLPLLAASNVDALVVFADARASLGQLAPQDLQALEEAIQGLAFDAAYAVCQRVLAQGAG